MGKLNINIYIVLTLSFSWSLFDGKHIQWSHLIKLYQFNFYNAITPGSTLLPKLKYEHV